MTTPYELAKLRAAGFGQGGGRERGGGGGNFFSSSGPGRSEAVGNMFVAKGFRDVSINEAKSALKELNKMRSTSILGIGYSEAEENTERVRELLQTVAYAVQNSARGEQAIRQVLSQAKIKVGSEDYNRLFRAIEKEMGNIANDGMSPSSNLMNQFQEQLDHFSPDRIPDGFKMWSLPAQEQWYKERGLGMDGKPTRFGVQSESKGFWGKLFGK